MFTSYQHTLFTALAAFFLLLIITPSQTKPVVRFYANQFSYTTTIQDKKEQKQITLSGKAKVYRDDKALFADRIRIIGEKVDQAFAEGNVQVFDQGGKMFLYGQLGEYRNFPDNSPKEDFTKISNNPLMVYNRQPESGQPSTTESPIVDYDPEPYQLKIFGTVFTRYENSKRINIEGPVRFSKSNEYLHGRAKAAYYTEDDEILHLQGDCYIVRGDDIYQADNILYDTNQKLLILKGQVSLYLFDYRLDPFEKAYQNPFAANYTDSQTNNKADAFKKRRYQLLTKLQPKSLEKRYQLRQFLLSKTRISGDLVRYNREGTEETQIIIEGNGFLRNEEVFFLADYLEVLGNGDRDVNGYGNIYSERFASASFSFAQKMRYYQDGRWGKLFDSAHLILAEMAQPNWNKDFSQQIITHLRSDEIERHFPQKMVYLKGNVIVNHYNQNLSSTYGELQEERKMLKLIGTPRIEQTNGSILNADFILLDLNQENANLNDFITGEIFAPSPVKQYIEQIPLFHARENYVRILDSARDKRIWGQRAIPHLNFFLY